MTVPNGVSQYPLPNNVPVHNSGTRRLTCVGDFVAPDRRGVRGEMDGMSISGHPGHDALYGRPRQDGPKVRVARRAAESGTHTGQSPSGPMLFNSPRFLQVARHATDIEFTPLIVGNPVLVLIHGDAPGQFVDGFTRLQPCQYFCT